MQRNAKVKNQGVPRRLLLIGFVLCVPREKFHSAKRNNRSFLLCSQRQQKTLREVAFAVRTG
ncbi:hypothetical protein Krac_11792 [Ktedonobacter racemifer DSM 44963]|uniref:Uncharacterized protein n=1 Tax=Ktedonobacter racemifer DSM 44963 TaxID=485913 RepID=D6TDQ0_KTERA|nr:hypothetical protein Krac_11792 [Ktedonobacter racemifer DSM 44963]